MKQDILVVDVNVCAFQCFCSIPGHESASLGVAGVKLSQLVVKNLRRVGRRHCDFRQTQIWNGKVGRCYGF
jgi:hypothetical protein